MRAGAMRTMTAAAEPKLVSRAILHYIAAWTEYRPECLFCLLHPDGKIGRNIVLAPLVKAEPTEMMATVEAAEISLDLSRKTS
jgi:hypothetical protein